MDSADGLLVARIAAGDAHALGEVFDRFGPVVYGAAQRLLSNSDAAEDVLQDTFVALWSDPGSYDSRLGTLRTYLCMVARRRALDLLRSESRRVQREHRHQQLVPAQSEPSPGEQVAETATADLVREAVRQLPAEQRQVIELAYFRGLSYRDVAVCVGIPEGTAKSRLRLAMGRLGSMLDRELLEQS